MRNVNWGSLLSSVLQLGAGLVLLLATGDSRAQELGLILIGTGVGQNLPSPFRGQTPVIPESHRGPLPK